MISTAKTTFRATCPYTGEIVTRKSSHPYTHALAARITRLMEQVPGTKSLYFDHMHQVPAGWTVISRPGRNHRGTAIQTQPCAVEQFPELGIYSFHESEELARKAARTLEWNGMRRVEFVAVPCSAS